MLDQIVDYMIGTDHSSHLSLVVSQRKMAHSCTVHHLYSLCYRGIIRDSGRRVGHKPCYSGLEIGIRAYHFIEHIARCEDTKKVITITDEHATGSSLLHLPKNRTEALLPVDPDRRWKV